MLFLPSLIMRSSGNSGLSILILIFQISLAHFYFFKLTTWHLSSAVWSFYAKWTLIHLSESCHCKDSFSITPVKEWSNVTQRKVQQARPNFGSTAVWSSKKFPVCKRKDHRCFPRRKPSSHCSSRGVRGKEWEYGQEKQSGSIDIRYFRLQKAIICPLIPISQFISVTSISKILKCLQ